MKGEEGTAADLATYHLRCRVPTPQGQSGSIVPGNLGAFGGVSLSLLAGGVSLFTGDEAGAVVGVPMRLPDAGSLIARARECGGASSPPTMWRQRPGWLWRWAGLAPLADVGGSAAMQIADLFLASHDR